jgi:Fe-S-cluster-containing dehydrogenase component/DMSO reductase anchor subunit
MTRWAMVADLERCVGCQTCTAACRHSNATSPAVQWRKVIDVEAGIFPNVSRTFVPVGCQHCADPPCMHVCPSTATRQRPDGIVTIDYSICIGCAYCEIACPYQARFLLHEPHTAYGPAMQNEIERADDDRIGVAQKCTFCSDRIDFGIENGLTPGVDPRATPACVNACIADALHFGDVDDPNSNVSQLLRKHKNFKMHAELKTEPGFFYLYGDAKEPEGQGVQAPEGGRIRTRGVEPALQQHWNWKAAMNFICGGMGSGLLMAVAIAALWNAAALPLGWPALALIALGLATLLLKIGRPLRAAYVLRQPRRSWMSREAWIVGALFPVGAFALWTGVSAALIAAVVLALAFLFSQAMIMYAAKGIPVWRNGAVVPLIMVTGLAEGCGLFLAAASWMPNLGTAVSIAAACTALFAVLREVAWRVYLGALRREGAPARSLAVLQEFAPSLLVGGVVLPILLVLGGAVFATAAPILFTGAGLISAAVGVSLKFMLVTRASYNQGFALTHTPVRGAGTAGPGVKPGWAFLK